MKGKSKGVLKSTKGIRGIQSIRGEYKTEQESLLGSFGKVKNREIPVVKIEENIYVKYFTDPKFIRPFLAIILLPIFLFSVPSFLLHLQGQRQESTNKLIFKGNWLITMD